MRPEAVPPTARPLPFRAAPRPSHRAAPGVMRAKALQRSMEHAGRAGAARYDRGGVCGGLGACGAKTVLGRARRCMLVLRAGAASGCSAPLLCSARSPPSWGARSGVLLGCARAPGGSCARRGVGRASCSGAMRDVRRGQHQACQLTGRVRNGGAGLGGGHRRSFSRKQSPGARVMMSRPPRCTVPQVDQLPLQES